MISAADRKPGMVKALGSLQDFTVAEPRQPPRIHLFTLKLGMHHMKFSKTFTSQTALPLF